MTTVTVHASRTYEVPIGRGLLAELGARTAAVVRGRTAAIVSDTNVAPLYLAQAEASLRAAGFATSSFVFPAGEGSKNGRTYRALLEDLHAVTTLTKQLYPGVPYFLLGHSMGSFYARQYLCEWGDELDGAIIMGTGYQPKALVQLARTICRVLAVFHGWHYRSKLVARLSFLGYNKGLEGRTAHDWLNRDPVEVDRYRADERCTFIFTLNAYYSMFSGILRLYDPALLARVPKDLPLLFLAGDADPVGEQGAGVKRAVKSLLDAGVKNIEVKLYPSARHELLVELNREEVFADIGDWLDRRL